MGRDHRQLEPGCELHRADHLALVVGTAGALQLEVEALRESGSKLLRNIHRAPRRPRAGLAHRAPVRADSRIRPSLRCSHSHLRRCLVAHHVAGPGARSSSHRLR